MGQGEKQLASIISSSLVLIEGDMMVDEWFIKQGRQVEKRGAILMKLKSKHSYYWPGTNLPDGGRIVRIPYTLRFGFFSRLFGKRRHLYKYDTSFFQALK